MEKGKVEFDDPNFKPRASTSYRTPEATPRAVLSLALLALQSAPHKHRFDFPPYWHWYDGERADAVAALEQHLK